MPHPLSGLADELGDLERELAPLKAKLTRAEALRKLLRSAHKGEAAGESFLIDGSRWRVMLGAMSNESAVNAADLFQLAGADAFLRVASVSLKALEGFSPAVVASVVTTTQTGTRALTVVPAPEPAPVAPEKKARKRGK